MPNSRHRDGRNGKHARAIRRSRNNLRRQLRRLAMNGRQAYATLLAVLAQSGGEIVVTQGMLDQVAAQYDKLGFSIEPRKEGEFAVLLTEAVAPDGLGESLADETDTETNACPASTSSDPSTSRAEIEPNSNSSATEAIRE